MATTQEKISSTSELAPGDLPDPLDLPAKSPASGDADEIISQLAANQIDKMLADANVEPAEAVIEEPSEIVTPDPATIEPAAIEADTTEPLATEPSDEHKTETTDEEFSKILSDEPPSYDRAPATDSTDAVDDALASVQSAAEELARELEADKSSSRRSFDDHSNQSRHHESTSAVGVRLGFNILSAINSPFQNLSDGTRELLGSIAIITLVNAMSILLYVMIYR